ncbi:hypothetical protein RI129_000123 [Pyrocoelia pectoralis]|uniref:CCHC-type domain-containing protein n=1 Tax=Pyrocoelia pectoralis TaxID=417401 RepID=A0AAN7V221_9COLE
MLREKVNPAAHRVAVRNIRRTRAGVIVECTGKEGAERLAKAIGTTTEGALQGREVKKGIPRVLLRKVDKELDKEEIMRRIVENNGDLVASRGGVEAFAGEIRERFRQGGRGHNPFVDIIYEVHPELRKAIVGKELSLGWSSAWVEDHISLLYCYRCWGLGHMARNCKDEVESCGRCGEKGHRRINCPADEPKCSMCTRVNEGRRVKLDTRHETLHPGCEAMGQYRRGVESRIDYG